MGLLGKSGGIRVITGLKLNAIVGSKISGIGPKLNRNLNRNIVNNENAVPHQFNTRRAQTMLRQKVMPRIPILNPPKSSVILPNNKTFVCGFGGNLCFGHMNLAETLAKIFNPENVSVFTKDREIIEKTAYKIVEESEIYNEKLLRGRSVYLISPSYTHFDYVKKMSENKEVKKIFVDKPMCVLPSELEEMKNMRKNGQLDNIFAGDHYYFSNIAGLRLMGVDMPYVSTVKINFDNTTGKRFSQSIKNAVSYFNENEIQEIKTVMHEVDVKDLCGRPWYKNKLGGGLLIDFQLHVHNLLNLMGLKLSKVEQAFGLRYPYQNEVMEFINSGREIKELKSWDSFNPEILEDAAWAKGRINGRIPIEMETIRYALDNPRYIEIIGKNGQKIKINASSSQQKVQLFDENNLIMAEAVGIGNPYELMIKSVEEGKELPKGFEGSLFDAQCESLEQIFAIKKLIGNLPE